MTTSPRPVIVFPHLTTSLRAYFDRRRRARDELLFESVVLPLASVEDVETTCRSVRRYLPDGARVIVVHVVRRWERPTGLQGQALVESRHIRAQQLLHRAGERLEEAGVQTETRLEHSLDVIGAVDDVAAEEAADAIALMPHGTARWKRLLSGDVIHRLAHSTNRPIVVLGLATYVGFLQAGVLGYGAHVIVDPFTGGVELWLPLSDHLVGVDRNGWVLTAGIAFLSGIVILAEIARRLALDESRRVELLHRRFSGR